MQINWVLYDRDIEVFMCLHSFLLPSPLSAGVDEFVFLMAKKE